MTDIHIYDPRLPEFGLNRSFSQRLRFYETTW